MRLEPHVDNRGFFARTFCMNEFKVHGLTSLFEQSSLSHNKYKGVVRGMHFQLPPHAETKFVRCVHGAVFDVALDLRPASPTYLQWVGEHLDAEQGTGLYIPPGVAHGFQTQTDEADVLYQITPAFQAGHGRGVRWDDPVFGIRWPLEKAILSDRDASYEDWVP